MSLTVIVFANQIYNTLINCILVEYKQKRAAREKCATHNITHNNNTSRSTISTKIHVFFVFRLQWTKKLYSWQNQSHKKPTAIALAYKQPAHKKHQPGPDGTQVGWFMPRNGYIYVYYKQHLSVCTDAVQIVTQRLLWHCVYTVRTVCISLAKFVKNSLLRRYGHCSRKKENTKGIIDHILNSQIYLKIQ